MGGTTRPSASDALSGIATNTCQSISGPAYLFVIGTNTYAAVATDKAGNQTSTQVTFTVAVTFQAMRNLVDRFVSSAGVANALDAKLDRAESAATAGDSKGKACALSSFANQLDAQSGKAISADNAAVLERLIQYL